MATVAERIRSGAPYKMKRSLRWRKHSPGDNKCAGTIPAFKMKQGNNSHEYWAPVVLCQAKYGVQRSLVTARETYLTAASSIA